MAIAVREQTVYEILTNLDPYQPDIVRSSGWVEAASARNARSKKHASGIRYSDAHLANARPARWAWDQRILIDYINLLVGEEGIGKGNLVAWILAQVTRGKLPGSLFGSPRDVAIAGDEDSFENIWVPRLHVAGASLRRVKYIHSGASGILDVREDAEPLRAFVNDLGIAVLYFDQLLDNLGYTDTWKDKQIRDALAPLRRIAQESSLAVLAAMHPNKRGGSFRDRISGSAAFNALSRSSLLVSKHPYDDERRIAVRAKGNYAAEPPGFEFRIEQTTVEIPPAGHRHRALLIQTSKIVEQRDTAVRTTDVLDPSTDRRREDSKMGAARRALSALFADGEHRRCTDVHDELAPLGLPTRTISDAARELGLRKYQKGYPGVWWWDPREVDQ